MESKLIAKVTICLNKALAALVDVIRMDKTERKIRLAYDCAWVDVDKLNIFASDGHRMEVRQINVVSKSQKGLTLPIPSKQFKELCKTCDKGDKEFTFELYQEGSAQYWYGKFGEIEVKVNAIMPKYLAVLPKVDLNRITSISDKRWAILKKDLKNAVKELKKETGAKEFSVYILHICYQDKITFIIRPLDWELYDYKEKKIVAGTDNLGSVSSENSWGVKTQLISILTLNTFNLLLPSTWAKFIAWCGLGKCGLFTPLYHDEYDSDWITRDGYIKYSLNSNEEDNLLALAVLQDTDKLGDEITPVIPLEETTGKTGKEDKPKQKKDMKQLDMRQASVYCGTYKKYNSGSLEGAWINLANYSSAKEFYTKCAEIHKDEEYPEFMFQDTEHLPSEMYTEDSIYSDYWTVMEEVKTWAPEKEDAFCEFLDENGYPADSEALEEFLDSYTKQPKEGRTEQPIKGLHAEVIEGGIGIVADETKYTFMHRKEMKECGAKWNKETKQWQATDEESIKKLTDWLAGKLVIQVDERTDTKEEKFECDLQKFLNTQSECWRDYYRKKCVAAVEFTPGHYLLFEKKEIKKEFCFGYSDFGQGPTQEEATRECNSISPKYVKSRNMEFYQDMEDDIKTGAIRMWAGKEGQTNHTDHVMTERHFLAYIRDTEHYVSISRANNPDVYTKIEKCFEYAKKSFEKRIDSYLKKYGVSKIKAWTYWLDE